LGHKKLILGHEMPVLGHKCSVSGHRKMEKLKAQTLVTVEMMQEDIS
jgi:hypothetical protein